MGKYLEDIGIYFQNTPQGWNLDDDRQEQWKIDRKKYGFDERETWSLDYSFKLWLFERLFMYNDIVRDCGMLNSNKFNYKGKEITQQECVDRILEGLKLDLTLNDFDKKREDKNIKEKIDDVMPLFLLCLNTLWW